MKKGIIFLIVILSAVLVAGCNGRGREKKKSDVKSEVSALPDTGFTGITQYKNNGRMVKEITFKNGVRDGLMKSYYVGGQLFQTFWYENGLKEDSARYYYPEGQLFRTTPYKHDTIDGIQKQFYSNGAVKAKIGFSKGLRTPFLQEFTKYGKLIGKYPEILVVFEDLYSRDGSFKIILGISEMNAKVKFYRGEFTDNRFDTTKCSFIAPVSGKYILTLKKSQAGGSDHVGIIASILTPFGNKNLTYKKIDLPYKDLN